ncbi:hypothetical protein Ga0123461_0730 [Mariprofundus aestuarium]|uniref:Lipoprotein n=1 Tax=Mariprofundus aestuarium TaxID=1921086 RepID=A0A2K8L2G9_MARES|nr:hypothetical protein Ga0123461_0730 [Mariprofundus aestuarium]
MKTVLRLFCLFLILCAAGCAAHQPLSADREQQKIDALTRDLLSLHSSIDRGSARMVARTAVLYSRELADRYGVTGSPRFHNLLVNVGLKERGLCYQWTDDLLVRLKSLGVRLFDFHSAVAHRDSDLREHSSVVVTPHGTAFETGIMLDGWRYSGDLYWSAVQDDSYEWSQRYPNLQQQTGSL